MNRRDFFKRIGLSAAFIKLGGLFGKKEDLIFADGAKPCLKWTQTEGKPLPPLTMETIEKAFEGINQKDELRLRYLRDEKPIEQDWWAMKPPWEASFEYPISRISCGAKFGKTFMSMPEELQEAWLRWSKHQEHLRAHRGFLGVADWKEDPDA